MSTIAGHFLPRAVGKLFKMAVFVLPKNPGVWSRGGLILNFLGRSLFFGSAPDQSKDKNKQKATNDETLRKLNG